MAQATTIEWTDLSWNPVHGCSVVSPGCAHCYAATLSLRYGHTEKPWTPANAAENVILKPHKLREPLSGAKAWQGLGAAAAAAGKTDGKLVFVNSMSDLFHEQIPDEYISEVFAAMAAAPHTFQILTKRPERMRDWFAWEGDSINQCGTVRNHFDWHYADRCPPMARLFDWPLPNVWLGVSIENRRFTDRADLLRDTPAAVRFISAEPLLGPLISRTVCPGTAGGCSADPEACMCPSDDPTIYGGEPWSLDLYGIDWLIIGGESGSGHRPMRLEWARDLVDAARRGGTAPFVKQLGGARPGTAFEDLPEDLRIREFPRG